MKKSYKIILLLLSIVAVLSVAKVILHNAFSTSGIFISKIEQEIKDYKTQNAIMSEELLATSSLTNLAQKAKQEGFVDSDSLMVIKSSKPLAINQ